LCQAFFFGLSARLGSLILHMGTIGHEESEQTAAAEAKGSGNGARLRSVQSTKGPPSRVSRTPGLLRQTLLI